ncbi:unnamed protein product [Cunninghamella echinulata]
MPLFSKKIPPTTITTDIEKATSNTEGEVDWSLVFQICEVINNSELGAKEARKLLQKKMLVNNPKTQVVALEILNALSENCREKFKSQLAAKTFGEDLETLATQKAFDDNVHSKLVQCLQNWVSNFGTDPSFVAICRVHEIVIQGVPPATNSNRLSNNLFRPQSFTRDDAALRQQQPREHKPVDIMSDVELAKNSAQVFSQTLSFTDPTQEDITKNELIQEFYKKCKMFQKVISAHLQTCNDSEMISALIFANGELVNSFKAYDDMLERRAIDTATSNSRVVNSRDTRQDETLINTDTSASGTSTHLETPSSSKPMTSALPSNTVDPFDPFADSNQSNEQSSSSNNGSSLPPPLQPQKLHD